MGWASSISDLKPSYVRLNVLDKKFGGDSRVSKVELFSYANDAEPRYGKEYEYVLPDKTSSGVAEFEPLMGAEESVFTQPVWYDANDKKFGVFKFANENSFLEEPVGADLYPGANVGYSRVIERNLTHNSISIAQSGVNVTEFYTAKDFPTKSQRSASPKPNPNIETFNLNISVPFLGRVGINNTGYSMGYTTELSNAMYGAVKRSATYPYTLDDPSTIQAVTSTSNYYKTNRDGSLNNEVTVLMKEGIKQDVLLGKETEFYVGMMENRNRVMGGGIEPDISFTLPFIIIPSLMPSLEFNQSITRYVSTNKIIYNSGILDSVVQVKDGSKIVTKNLFYDYETGESIITSVTQEWNRPIFSYNFPAHWSYPSMQGAYRNYRAQLSIQPIGSKYKLSNSSLVESEIFHDGDEILIDVTRYYVSEVTGTDFALMDRENSPPPNNTTYPIKTSITKSGYRNLQSTKKGAIVTERDVSQINNIQIDPFLRLFTNYNLNQSSFYSPTSTNGVLGEFDYGACDIDSLQIGFSWNRSSNQLMFYFRSSNNNSECGGHIDSIDQEEFASMNLEKLRFLLGTWDGVNTIQMVYDDLYNRLLNGRQYTFILQNNVKCFSCEERQAIAVLQANATEFSENWGFDYNNLFDESTERSGVSITNIANGYESGNAYAYGFKGIWRPMRTSAYLIDRKQSGVLGNESRIDIDGEFKEFYLFDHARPIEYNESYNWRWTNTVTEYNVNGSSIEGKNRLNTFSSSIFGYKNHLVTAVASNAKEHEILYDGFEDYEENSGEFENDGRSNLDVGKCKLVPWGHTGNYSLRIWAGQRYEVHQVDLDGSKEVFTPIIGKTYSVSYWAQTPDQDSVYGIASYEIGGRWYPLSNLRVTQVVDGWFQYYGEIIIPVGTPTNESFSLIFSVPQTTNSESLFDDIRVHPYNASMESYVYDPDNYRLKAVLNNLNFATFFNYDSEGALVGKRIETERGIQTLTTNRNHIAK